MIKSIISAILLSLIITGLQAQHQLIFPGTDYTVYDGDNNVVSNSEWIAEVRYESGQLKYVHKTHVQFDLGQIPLEAENITAILEVFDGGGNNSNGVLKPLTVQNDLNSVTPENSTWLNIGSVGGSFDMTPAIIYLIENGYQENGLVLELEHMQEGINKVTPNPTRLIVNYDIPYIVALDGDIDVCPGVTSVYNTDIGKSDYDWNISPGGIIVNGGGRTDSFVEVMWNTLGNQTVRVVHDHTYDQTLQVTVHALHMPNISGEPMACILEEVMYTVPNTLQEYNWDIPPQAGITGGSPTSSEISVEWMQQGDFQVSLNYTDEHGCESTMPVIFNTRVNQEPTPIISGNDFTCLQTMESFSTAPGKTNYVWTCADHPTIDVIGNMINFQWVTSGPKDITVTYVGENGCSPLEPGLHTINVLEPEIPTINGETNSCINATKTYTAEAGMLEYQWSLDGGSVVSGGGINDDFIEINWNTVGISYVRLSVLERLMDQVNCHSILNEMSVTVSNPDIPTITGLDELCEGTTETYRTETGKINYQWNVPSGAVIVSGGSITDDYVEVQWNTPGNNTISVLYNNELNCVVASPTEYHVMVHAYPQITGVNNACLGDRQMYTTDAGMSSYSWNVTGGGNIISGGGTGDDFVEVEWITAGSQNVSVYYVGGFGCNGYNRTNLAVNVNEPLVPGISGDLVSCRNSTVNYSTDMNMSNYNWVVPSAATIVSGGSTTDHNIQVQWNESGQHNFSVHYTDANGCVTPVKDNTQVVNAIPVPSISGNLNVIEGTRHTYTTESGMSNYIWEISKDGIITNGGTATDNFVEVEWNSVGEQTVSTSYTNGDGCHAVLPASISVMVATSYIPQLIGHWPMNGNTNDVSGNDNHGGVTEALLTKGPHGNDNSAYHFDGVDDNINIGNKETFNNDFTDGVTIVAWIKLDNIPSVASKNYNLISKGGSFDSAPHSPFSLTFAGFDDRLYFDLWSTDTRSSVKSGKTDWQADTWYHIVATWDGTSNANSQKIYVNGMLDNERAGTVDELLINSEDLKIGNCINRPFDGKIDDVLIYNYALTVSEIEKLYTPFPAMVGHWPLNGNGDELINGHNGTIAGGVTPTTDRFGDPSGAMEFNGVDGRIVVGDVNEYDFGINDFSLSCWMYINEESIAYQSLINKGGSGPVGYGMGVSNDNQYRAAIEGEGGTGQDLQTDRISTGSWHNLVAVFDRDHNYSIYVDGEFKASDIYNPGNENSISNSFSLVFGCYKDEIQWFFDGKLDDIRIYNYALAPEEISELYIPGPNLITRIPFDGDAQDVSGNNFHAANQGAAFTSDRYSVENNAIYFDGTGASVEIPSTGNLVQNKDLTLLFWIKSDVDETYTDYQQIINKNDVFNEYSLEYRASEKQLVFYHGDGSNYENIICPLDNLLQQWTQVAVIRNTLDKTITFYINGLKTHVANYTIDPVAFDNPTILGKRPGGGRELNGYLDDVRIYGSALTEEEIAEYYSPVPALIAYWPLDGNTNDISGNENHGNTTEAVLTTDPYGKESSAYHFDGINDDIYIGNKETFNQSYSNGVTVAAWVKLDNVPSAVTKNYGVISKGGTLGKKPVSPFALTFYEGNNTLYFDLYNSEETRSSLNTSKNDWEADKWYYIVATWNGTTNTNSQKIYIDGILDNQRAASVEDLIINDLPLQIGSSTIRPFDGSIDDVRIYNYELSESAIAELYIPVTKLVGYWPLDGNATDATENGNDGTISGAIATMDRFGNPTGAISFDGNDDFIGINNIHFASDKAWSLSTWINWEDYGNHPATSTFMGDKTTGSKCFSLVKNAEEKLGYRNTNLEYLWFNPFEPSNDELLFQTGWHQITVVSDGLGTMSVHIDGQFYQSITTDTEFDLNSFGMAYPTSQYSFNGAMDDIRLYNYALTETEIAAIYTPASALIAHWPLDGNANEEIRGVSGTVNGAIGITDRFNRENQAMYFDGNSYIESQGNELSGRTTASINFWCRIDDNQGWREIFSINDEAGNYIELRNLYASRYYLFLFYEGVEYSTVVYYPESLGEWDMVTVTFDGSLSESDRVKIYINGTLITNISSTSQSTLPNVEGHNFYLGSFEHGGNHTIHLKGALDDFKIYSSALTEEEITELYTPAELIAHWPLDGNATDATGNGNDGAISGAIAAADRFGNPTGAISFDGNDDFIGINNIHFASDEAWSLSTWFNWEQHQSL